MRPPVALVTGAGSGIGRAASIALLDAGFAVVLAGRNGARLEETASLSGQQADRFAVVATDVSDADSVENLYRTIHEKFTRLDLLFNNAGTGARPTPLDELPLAEWNRVVSVNLTGAFLCARAAFRMMKAQVPRGGRIINNGSLAAYVPRPLTAPYTVTKHAMTGLTRSISLEGRDFDIACGQIDIGNAATEMTASMEAGALQADGSIRAEERMDVADVARAVVYMARLPLSANVQFMTVMATKMPFIGRG